MRSPRWLGLLTAGLLACATGTSEPEAATTLELAPARIALPDGTLVDAEKGELQVPFRRADPASGRFGLEVFRLPRLGSPAGETLPLFVLHGGPGFPGLEAYAQQPGYYEGWLRPYQDVTDVIVVGQRGLGTSHGTPCEPPPPIAPDVAPSLEERRQVLLEASRRCRAEWEGRGVDLTGFTVLEAAADLRDVAEALGYDRIVLWGISFGSHWGMATLREFPELVARAVLSGMEGPDHTYDMPRDVLAALERISASAEESSQLSAALSGQEGVGILALVRQVLDRLEAQPETVILEGDGVEVRLTADDVRELILGTTSSTVTRDGIRTWPADMLALARGDFGPTARAVAEVRAEPFLSAASFFVLDCGSGISEARRRRLENDPAIPLVGDLGSYYDANCPAWESDLGEEFRTSFSTDVPTLIVQGDWDTSTPIENALELLSAFSNHHFVRVEGGSHLALMDAMSSSPEFRAAVLDFVASGDTEQLPETVSLPPLDWAVP